MRNQISNNNFVAESILKIGSVSEVKGKNIIIRVDKNKNAPHLIFDGRIIKNVSVGSYVKIAKGYNEIIGKIEGEFISEDKDLDINNYTNHKNKIKRFLNVTLVGYIESNVFKQGLKELPLIDNDCFLLNDLEFNCIHSFAKINDDKIKLGNLLNETNTPIELGVDKLFASHIGIFGNTGSGKSYTLSKVYYELLNKYKYNPNFQNNAKFILIDFNGEYAVDQEIDNIIIEKKFKNRFFLSTSKSDKDRFPIPESEVNDLTFWSILLKATEQTQKPFLDSSLNKVSLKESFENKESIVELFHKTIINILTQTSKNQDKDFHIYFINELLKIKSKDDLIFKNIESIKRDLKLNLTKDFAEIVYKRIDHSKKPKEFISAIWELNKTLDVDFENIDVFLKIRLKIIFNYFEVISKGYYSKEHIGPLYNRLEAKFKDIIKVFKISTSTIINDNIPLKIINLNRHFF